MKRKALLFVALLFVALALLVALLQSGRVWINATQSMPRGVYWLSTSRDAVDVGSIVLACPPAHAAAVAVDRRYTYHGQCAGGTIPLLKHVVAVAGDRVDLGAAGVRVNGKLLPASAPLRHDATGRELAWHAQSWILRPGQVWLYSPVARSFDSRYFGPVSRSEILGFGRPVLTERTQ